MSEAQSLFDRVHVAGLPGIAPDTAPGLLDALRGWAEANDARVQVFNTDAEDFANNRFSMCVETPGVGTRLPFVGRKVALVVRAVPDAAEADDVLRLLQDRWPPLADAARVVPFDVFFGEIDRGHWSRLVDPGPFAETPEYERLRADLEVAGRECADAERELQRVYADSREGWYPGRPAPADLDARHEVARERSMETRKRFWAILKVFQEPRTPPMAEIRWAGGDS